MLSGQRDPAERELWPSEIPSTEIPDRSLPDDFPVAGILIPRGTTLPLVGLLSRAD